MEMGKATRRLLFGVLAAFALIQSAHALEVPLANIHTVADADVYAKALIEKIAAENAEHPELATDPLMILHVGNDLPAPLRWVITSLDRAHIPYEIDLITQDQMENSLDDASKHALESTSILDYGEGPNAEQALSSVMGVRDKAKLMVKRIFGMPNGFTLWMKFKRDFKQKVTEGIAGGIQAVIAGVSLGFSLYLGGPHGGVAPHIVPAVGAMIAWVAANAYWGRPIAEWINQGRSMTETSKGKFSVRKGRTFFYLSQFVRSMLNNAIVVGSAFGLEGLLSGQGWMKSIQNTAVNMVARSWVDNWIYSHQATTKPDGTVVTEKGQWSPKKTIIVGVVWNVLYGLLKTLDLLAGGPFHIAYLTMGVVGGIKLLYDERFWFKHKWERVIDAIRGAAHNQCESLIIRKSAIRPLAPQVAAAG